MRFLFVFAIVSLLMAGCKPSDHEVALSFIEQTKQFIADNDEAAALSMIDSVHAVFPKDIPVRRMADTLKWEIELRQTERSLPFVDSKLVVLEDSIQKLTKKFKYIRNKEFQDYGSFEHRLLRTENNTSRCYLKPVAEERGGFSLTSYYVGAKAEHDRIKVSVEDAYVESLPAPLSCITQFVDLDLFHEIIVFNGETLNGIDHFITGNKDKRIKISLLGGKRPYVYYLNKNEREVISQTYILALTLADYNKFTDQQLRMTQKVEVLNKRLNK